MQIAAYILAVLAFIGMLVIQAPSTPRLIDLIADAKTADEQARISRLLDVIGRRLIVTTIAALAALIGAVVIGVSQ